MQNVTHNTTIELSTVVIKCIIIIIIIVVVVGSTTTLRWTITFTHRTSSIANSATNWVAVPSSVQTSLSTISSASSSSSITIVRTTGASTVSRRSSQVTSASTAYSRLASSYYGTCCLAHETLCTFSTCII